jgi:hypothetical protein
MNTIYEWDEWGEDRKEIVGRATKRKAILDPENNARLEVDACRDRMTSYGGTIYWSATCRLIESDS